MTQRRSFLRIVVPLAILLIVVALVAILALLTWLRGRAAEDRPVVFIHSPANGERLQVGEGTIIHATARSDRGLARMELWADGDLAGEASAPEGTRPTTLLLVAPWEPTGAGYHLITVRAFSGRAEASATINVEALDEGPALGAHVVTEGETVAGVAAAYGASPASLDDLNPGLPPTGPEAGDALIVPLDFLPSDDPAQEPQAGGEPEYPAPEPGEPSGEPSSDEGAVRLRLEALELNVDAAYEGVHCYAGVGRIPPAWIPDADHDPATDESFEPLGGAAWDIASHYSADAAPSISWPANGPLPFEISCVGILGSGSDAVELGRVALSVPPSEWDGVTRTVDSEPAEGAFTLAYRVGPGELYTLDLDPAMPPPFNLRLDERRQSLRWEYELPEGWGHGFHGFLIFLNDSLVWTVGRDVRESRLPDQWFTPPCDEEYVFTARAFVAPYPEGPYSPPSNEVVIAGAEAGPGGCTRSFVVSFVTLETRDLGGDGDLDPGDMGPVYGGVYVNDLGQEYDGRCESPGGNLGYICDEQALNHNTLYDMASLPWETPGEFGGIFVEVHEGESLGLRFSVLDEDSGWNNGDDLVCEGGTSVSWMELERGDYVEGTMTSEQSGGDGEPRCEVNYTVGQVGGPVGVAGGGVPLPWLDVVDRSIDPETGRIQVHVRNTGTAAWANHDLTMSLFHRIDLDNEGENYTWPEVYLGPGDPATVFTWPEDLRRSAANVCVELDSRDRVLELYEVYDVVHHGPICPDLPDLVLEDVLFDEGSDRLLWTVRNLGEGEVEDTELDVELRYGNREVVILSPPPGATYSLARRDSIVMDWPGDMLDREDMLTGFTLTVDPSNDVVEEVEDNNSAEVREGAHLQLELRGGRLLWYPTHLYDACGSYVMDNPREQDITLEAYVESSSASERVASWSLQRTVGWPGWMDLDFVETNREDETYLTEFDIAGWETLRLWVSGELHNDSLGSGSARLGPDEDWGTDRCQPDDHVRLRFTPDENDWWRCGSWYLDVRVCEVPQ